MSDEFSTYVPRLGDQRLLGTKPFEGVSVETLALFDHDHLGNHAFVQYWDHRQDTTEWSYAVLGAFSETGWTWSCVHDFGPVTPPSFAAIGARVDQYLTTPESLRFILR